MFSAIISIMNYLVTGLCTVLLVAACHLAKAYDFRDVDFNQHLYSELEDAIEALKTAPSHHRARRDEDAANIDEKCKRRGCPRRPKLCCAEESQDALNEKTREHFRTCYKEVTGIEKGERHEHGPHRRHNDMFSCEEVEKRKSDMTCVHECLGKRLEILDESGNAVAEGLTKHLEESFAKESWFDLIVERVVSNCIAEAKNVTENPAKFYTEVPKICNPSGITLKYCMFKEIQLSCPEDQIKDKASCDRFQDRIKKGMDFYGPSPPPMEGIKDE